MFQLTEGNGGATSEKRFCRLTWSRNVQVDAGEREAKWFVKNPHPLEAETPQRCHAIYPCSHLPTYLPTYLPIITVSHVTC